MRPSGRVATARPAPASCHPPLLCAECVSDLLAEQLPLRRPRHNPRAVKRKMSNYPLKPPRLATHTKAAPPPAPPSIRVLWR